MQFKEEEIYRNLSEEELEQWYQDLKLRKNALIVIFGIGNGIYLTKLIQEISNDIHIVIYEPDKDTLYYFADKFNLYDELNDSRVSVYSDSQILSPERLEMIFKKHIQVSNANRVLFLTYPKYNLLYPQPHAIFGSVLRTFVKRMETKSRVIIKYGKSYIENIFNNYHKYFMNSKSFDSIKDSIDNTLPVFVVSAGPSLDENIELLRSIQNKVYIISVDTAFRSLYNNGITPDLLVSVDALKNKDHLFKDMPSVPMFSYLQTNKDILDNHNGDKIFIDSRAYEFHYSQYLKDNRIELPKIETGGSVSCSAFTIARKLGFVDICLLGLDLAYPNNKTYTKDSISKNKQIEIAGRVMVDSNNGTQVLSTKVFGIYKEWYEVELKKYPKLSVYNINSNGALIRGTKIISLSDFINNRKKFDDKKEIKLSNLLVDNTLDKDQYIHIVIDTLIEFKDSYKKAYELIDQYLASNDTEYPNYLYDVDLIINTIENNQEEKYKMIYYILYRIQKEINELILEISGYEKYSKEFYITKNKYIFLVIQEIDIVLNKLNKMIE